MDGGEGAIIIRNKGVKRQAERAKVRNLTICTKERGKSQIYTRIAPKTLDICTGEWYLDVKIIKQIKKQNAKQTGT